MKNFLEQVENQLHKKSERELRTIVLRLASKLTGALQQEFLGMLEDKRLVIETDSGQKPDAKAILENIRDFLENIACYNIEAYYNESYHWDYDGDDGWKIEDDDGFMEDITRCYASAELLLIHGMHVEAAEAFRLLFEAMDKFDAHYENHEYGPLYVSSFIEEDSFDIDLFKAKSLRGYTALLAQGKTDVDLRDDLEYIFEMCNAYEDKITFSDVLHAGSEPVPSLELVLEKWVEVLHDQAPRDASPLVKEAAYLAKKPEIMEHFTMTAGSKEPLAYLDLIQVMKENEPESKMIEVAKMGLENTDEKASRRSQLASLLVDMAKNADKDVYVYALLEHFRSDTDVYTYIPLYRLNNPDVNNKALQIITPPSHFIHYTIHFINKSYDMVFNAIKNEEKSLGWSGSIKGMLFPLFMGILVKFSKESTVIKNLVGNGDLYNLLSEIGCEVTKKQDAMWYEWCVKEAEARADAIVRGQHRRSYYKAANLVAAVYEMRLLRKEDNPKGIVADYQAKFPRHTAFKSELQTAVNAVKIRGVTL